MWKELNGKIHTFKEKIYQKEMNKILGKEKSIDLITSKINPKWDIN